MKDVLYFDYTANTPADDAVLEHFLNMERTFIGNVNSNHIAGFKAKTTQDAITKNIAQMLSIDPEEIIYTSGASESNNTAIRGIARTKRHIGKHIITTPLEHSSVSAPLSALQEEGYEIEMVKIDSNGCVDLTDLKELLRNDTILVTVSAVDSELGTVQPLKEISEIVHAKGSCALHVDATQAIGKIPLHIAYADTASFTAHKFYGLNGSGILYKKHSMPIEPLIYGGKSTTLFRSGTPTLSLNGALEKALEISLANEFARFERVYTLNNILKERLLHYKGVSINSPKGAIPHILNISTDLCTGIEFQKALSKRNVCVSVKAACASDALPSRAVFAVSKNRKRSLTSWRISLSHLTKNCELDAFIEAFDSCYKEFQSK